MDARRNSRVVSDPKVRHVGFFTPSTRPHPGRTQSGPPAAGSPPFAESPASNSLSPVMITPPRHLSDAATRTASVTVPDSAFRRTATGDHVPVGSYNPSESLLGTSTVASPTSVAGDGELDFSEESSAGWHRRRDSGRFASSFPCGGFELAMAKASENSAANAKNLPAASEAKKALDVRVLAEKSGGVVTKVQNEPEPTSKPLKAKTTKAERRALQEAQRAAKAATKEGSKSATVSGGVAPSKPMKQPSQRKDASFVAPSVAASEKKGGDRVPEKERKKDVPPPRMQFDDKNRVEKAKKHSVFHQTEARNRVELFRHLPQYEHGTQLPDLASKYFQLEPLHPGIGGAWFLDLENIKTKNGNLLNE